MESKAESYIGRPMARFQKRTLLTLWKGRLMLRLPSLSRVGLAIDQTLQSGLSFQKEMYYFEQPFRHN